MNYTTYNILRLQDISKIVLERVISNLLFITFLIWPYQWINLLRYILNKYNVKGLPKITSKGRSEAKLDKIIQTKALNLFAPGYKKLQKEKEEAGW